jgi:hypothetical protein
VLRPGVAVPGVESDGAASRQPAGRTDAAPSGTLTLRQHARPVRVPQGADRIVTYATESSDERAVTGIGPVQPDMVRKNPQSRSKEEIRMGVRARVSRGAAAMLFAGGVLLANASGAAAADTLPVPSAPHVNSATLSGGETLVSVTNPTPPSGGIVSNVFFANGRNIDPILIRLGNPAQYGFRASVAPAGAVITARATVCIGNPDDGTQQCAASALSNAVTVR